MHNSFLVLELTCVTSLGQVVLSREMPFPELMHQVKCTAGQGLVWSDAQLVKDLSSQMYLSGQGLVWSHLC